MSVWEKGGRWCSCTVLPWTVACGSRSWPPWRTSSPSSHGTSRGPGRSSDVPADFGLPDYAHCLAALIEEVGLGPAHVAGLSWGGTVVLELYRHHPELVATLILIDTYAGWKGSLPEEEVRARVEGLRQMLAVPDDHFDPTLPGWFAGDPPAAFAALLEEMAADVRPESLRMRCC